MSYRERVTSGAIDDCLANQSPRFLEGSLPILQDILPNPSWIHIHLYLNTITVLILPSVTRSGLPSGLLPWGRSLFWDIASHRLVVSCRCFGSNVGPIFEGEAVKFLGLLDPWIWDWWVSRNVGNYVAEHPKEGRSHLHCGGGLKHRISWSFQRKFYVPPSHPSTTCNAWSLSTPYDFITLSVFTVSAR